MIKVFRLSVVAILATLWGQSADAHLLPSCMPYCVEVTIPFSGTVVQCDFAGLDGVEVELTPAAQPYFPNEIWIDAVLDSNGASPNTFSCLAYESPVSVIPRIQILGTQEEDLIDFSALNEVDIYPVIGMLRVFEADGRGANDIIKGSDIEGMPPTSMGLDGSCVAVPTPLVFAY